jgi:citrate synthase
MPRTTTSPAPGGAPTRPAHARLTFGALEQDLPVVTGADGRSAVDISALRAATGLTTFDPGLANTATCRSAVTHVDGERGVLLYRGVPVDVLAERGSFLETAYLLIHGDQPSAAELDEFAWRVQRHTMLHEDVKRFFDGFPRDAHPMAMLSAVVSALSTFYQDSHDPRDPQQLELSALRLLAKLPTIAAYSYKKSIGQPFLYPDNQLDLLGNFLRMTFGVPAERYEIDPLVTLALNRLLILHADHEQNCSTSTLRLVGSGGANFFASVAAAINALWGHLHGGANQAVIEMLERIRGDGGDVARYVALAKDPSSGFRLMGFGHRVYKTFDPRGRLIRETAAELLPRLGGGADRLLDIAVELEAVALEDPYFLERNLYPNVDFYSGLIYRAMGFPTNMFTVIFAIGRVPGWIAHWKELMGDPDRRIGRPRQVYTGPMRDDAAPGDPDRSERDAAHR